MSSSSLAAKAREVRARAAVRSWEYRQRKYAKGTWFRVRRVLAQARACWLIPDEEVRLLREEGYQPEPAGLELAPPKMILLVPEERLATISGRRQIRIGLTPELLAAACIALVPFQSTTATK